MPLQAQSDVYKNMEGQWTGTVAQKFGAKLVTVPATMTVERDPKKPMVKITLKFDPPKAPADMPAAPAAAGRGGPARGAVDPVKELVGISSLELKPGSETMIRHSSGPEIDFKTTGLKKFAETGSGAFVAKGQDTLIDTRGGDRQWMVHIEPGVFEWELQVPSPDGQAFIGKADFVFKKDEAAPAK
jgi:hypothetical protein